MLAPQKDELIDGGNLETALKLGLGGVIFFTRNILSVEQVKNFTFKIKKSSLISPFIGIDEEGGRVERTENIFGGKKFLSAKYQAEKGANFVEQETKNIAELIKSMGFNMNFAPVLDVNTNPKNPIIGERAYGETVEDVENFAVLAMKTYLKHKIIPVGKHFPGHGDASVDSHLTLPTLELSREEIENIHIKPFKTAIEKGIPAVMVAHLLCSSLTDESVPSSLSCDVLWYLRNKLKFEGIIVSDDMQMGALQSIDSIDAVVQGIKAGINLFLYRDSTDETIRLIENIYERVSQDEKLIKKIDDSFELTQAIKLSYNDFLSV